ncbi:MAG: restriction endonuclease subunit S [Lachnospiraceae bacterium]|nr:restriction endonuclease subunit S [Lachnospiraceae bacterium]
MNLNVSDWKPFKIQRTESQKGLFEIENCKCGSAGELDDGSDINYIGAKKSDNGVMRSVSLDGNTNLVSKGHGIMFICDGEGSVGYTNYMDSDFIGSTTTSIGYDDALTETNAMFLVSVLDNEKFKYSYGRKYRKNLINAEIYLPVQHNADNSIFIDETKKYSDEGYVPDWQFMEDYIKSLHHKPLSTHNNKKQVPDLKKDNWKEFRFGDLITDIYKAKAINKDDLSEASDSNNTIRYITRTSGNNGCELLADIRDIDSKFIEKANAISIGDTTATCFYQDEPFITGDHMVVVRADSWLNKYTAFFVLTLLNNEQYKYSYGRAFLMDRIKETLVKLPADTNGNPDWEFMENYIKSLPYGDRLEG